eukprot:12003318-Ditylum_brightwellii.AAC.2
MALHFMLTKILEGVVARTWNSEHFIIFVVVILQHKKEVHTFKVVCRWMEHMLNLWEKGNFAALVKNTVNTNKQQQPIRQQGKSKEHVQQVYTHMLPQGTLYQAIQWVTYYGKGGLLQSTKTDSKTGNIVNDVLLGKHPSPSQPPEEAL